MVEHGSLPEAFAKVHRRIIIDQKLRKDSGNTLDFANVIKRSLEGKPMHGGYIDDAEATAEQKKQLLDLLDGIGRHVQNHGALIEEATDLVEFYGEVDGIEKLSVRYIPTRTYNVVAGRRLGIPSPSFVTINSKSKIHDVDLFGEFDEEMYFLDLQFLSQKDSQAINYTVHRDVDHITRDDFEIAIYLAENAKSEIAQTL